MEKIDKLLNHLNLPKDKLNQHRCLKRIISLLPVKYKNFITTYTYKNNILTLFVKHPAIKQELFYNQKLIKEILEIMHSQNQCTEIKIDKIFTQYKYVKKPKIEKKKELKFYTHKVKDFEIKSKDPLIIKYFEEIKKNLKNS